MFENFCRSLKAGLFFSAAMLVAGSVHANLLTNGSFETPTVVSPYIHRNGAELPGWTLFSTYRGTVHFDTSYDIVTDGTQAVQIEVGGDWISQTFATVVGQSYTLTFDLTAYSGYGGPPSAPYSSCPCVASLRAYVGPASVTLTGNSGSYATHTIKFTAVASSTTVKFENMAPPSAWGNYPQVDNVSVTADAESKSFTFQGVTFTVTKLGNVMDVEIDAAGRNGDWATAMFIDTIQLSDIGTFASFSIGGDGSGWTPSSNQLNASGCGGGVVDKAACAQGTPIPLTDDMHFVFTFDSATTLDDTAPKLKVHFLDASFKKRGSLM